jgi:predicted small lipoprotein YifL
MRRVLSAMLFGALALWLVAGCGQKEPEQEQMAPPKKVEAEGVSQAAEPPPPPSWGLVTNGGFAGNNGWLAAPRTIVDGHAVLQKTEKTSWTCLRQTVTGLEPDSRYALSLTLRADTIPDDEVVANLIAKDYASARLIVKPAEIGPDFKRFERVVPSRTPPDTVTLRIYTRSSVPIMLDDVCLTKLG